MSTAADTIAQAKPPSSGRAGGGHAGQQRIGGLTLSDYADATAVRERLADQARLGKTKDGLDGDLANLWAGLAEHARLFSVPYQADDLEKTNRISDWDRLILLDRDVQAMWRQVYPRALVKACGADPESTVGRRICSYLKIEAHLLWNPMMPLGMRKPGVTLSIEYHARELAGGKAAAPPTPARIGVSSAMFPGEKVATLIDFARLEMEIQRGDFMGALYRAGLDPVSYARVSKRWGEALARDASLRADYAAILRGAVALGRASTMLMRPVAEPEIFPGEKLSRVSDFARIGRAAERGEFRRALAIVGVDLETFAHLTERFNARMQTEPSLETRFRALLKDARLDA